MTKGPDLAEETERWLDAFEHQWVDRPDPPDVLATCQDLRAKYPRAFEFDSVAWELAMTDLEFRWRRGSQDLRRGIRWYVEHLTSFGLLPEHLDELALHEMIVRSRWGDRPSIESLLEEQFPQMPPAEQSRRMEVWRSQLEMRFPIECNIIGGLHQRYRVNLRTPAVLGRQKSTDPSTPGPHPGAAQGEWRIVVAALHQNSVSRQQLKVVRTAVHTLQITPLNDGVPIYRGMQKMTPHQPLEMPCDGSGLELRFGGVTLHFRRAV